MSTEAFGSRRVTESLKAIAKYLDDGAQIAGGVPPGQVAKLNLARVTSNPGPRLTNVLWENGSHVITVTPGQKVDLKLSVSGSNLDDVKEFKLVTGATHLTAASLQSRTDVSFTASFEDITPSAGSYDAWVIDVAGQTFLRPYAVAVHTSVATQTAQGLQLGGVMIRHKAGGFGAVLAILRGSFGDAYISDKSGNRLSGWNVAVVKQEHESKQPWPELKQAAEARYKGVETRFLDITMPPAADLNEILYLTATSTAPVSEDRLVFFVESSQARS